MIPCSCRRGRCTFAGMALALAATAACNDRVVSPSKVAHGNPVLSYGGCWPPGVDGCVEEPLTQEQWEFARNAFLSHYNHKSSDPQCQENHSQVMADFGTGPADSKIRTADWPSRPPDQTGARHNGPGITHVYKTAFDRGARSVAKTIYHEHKHRFTSLSDYFIFAEEDYCIVEADW